MLTLPQFVVITLFIRLIPLTITLPILRHHHSRLRSTISPILIPNFARITLPTHNFHPSHQSIIQPVPQPTTSTQTPLQSPSCGAYPSERHSHRFTIQPILLYP